MSQYRHRALNQNHSPVASPPIRFECIAAHYLEHVARGLGVNSLVPRPMFAPRRTVRRGANIGLGTRLGVNGEAEGEELRSGHETSTRPIWGRIVHALIWRTFVPRYYELGGGCYILIDLYILQNFPLTIILW